MEPPPECRQETPALTEAAAKFLNFIGGCVCPAPPRPKLPPASPLSPTPCRGGLPVRGWGAPGPRDGAVGLSWVNGGGAQPGPLWGRGEQNRGRVVDPRGTGDQPSGQR